METEPSITDRFLNELERIFEQQGKKENIVFRARTLRDRGPHAPEHRFGADFCGVLDIRFRDFKQKAFCPKQRWKNMEFLCKRDLLEQQQ